MNKTFVLFGINNNLTEKNLAKYLTILRLNNIRCFLITNDSKSLNDFHYFDGIFSSGYLGYERPEEKFYKEVLVELNNPTQESILIFEEDIKNVVASRELGFEAELFFENSFAKLLRQYFPNIFS